MRCINSFYNLLNFTFANLFVKIKSFEISVLDVHNL